MVKLYGVVQESVKYDSGSSERNMTHWALLYNQTGKPILLEDCHNGNPAQATMEAGKLNCPMNLYRSSDDLHPAWHSVLLNLNSTMTEWPWLLVLSRHAAGRRYPAHNPRPE